MKTSCPYLLLEFLLTHWIILLRLLLLFEVTTLLVDLLLEELAADTIIRVVQDLVQVLTNRDGGVPGLWIELIDLGQVHGFITFLETD